jgi:diguanylate cyclase (GGDEF)-like protein/PAS domain S-box-containing protein
VVLVFSAFSAHFHTDVMASPFDSLDPFADAAAALEAALADTKGKLERMELALDHLDSGVVLYGADDRLIFCNRRFREIYAEIADVLVPGSHYTSIARAFYRRVFVNRTEMDEESWVAARLEDHRHTHEGGQEFKFDDYTWLLISDRRTPDGGVIGFRLDITARKVAEQRLAASEERFRSLLEMSSDWYWEQDANFNFTRISGGMARAAKVDPGLRLGRPRWEIPFLGISQEQMDEHRRQVENHQPFRDFQYAYEMTNHEIWWVSISGEPVFDGNGVFAGYRGVGSNITEKKRVEAQIREMAEYDFLTGLPNRMLLGARFDFAGQQAMRSGNGMALMFIDLDRFKNINDSLGHHVGDEILAETSRRLSRAVRTTDTVARHGGDEFVVLLPGATDAPSLGTIAQNIIDSIGRPHQIAERELTVTPSIGITIWPTDGEDLVSLTRNADIAMYHSKSLGRNQFSFFRQEMNATVNERLTIENALRRAIPQDELSLEYQPIFRLPEKRIVGVEALLRWNSRELGPVAPSRFIPVAEESGLIINIGEWVVREACAQLARWRAAGIDRFPVAINVAGVQFKTRRLIDVLTATLRQFELVPQDIEIELTESALVSEGDSSGGILAELSQAGFSLVIDDFGTGYSNLAYLRRFDIAKLKIDQSFVRDITTDADNAAITRGIISLAKSLGMRVVAEGVEHQAQVDFLLANGLEEAQGYLLSKPLAASVVAQSF